MTRSNQPFSPGRTSDETVCVQRSCFRQLRWSKNGNKCLLRRWSVAHRYNKFTPEVCSKTHRFNTTKKSELPLQLTGFKIGRLKDKNLRWTRACTFKGARAAKWWWIFILPINENDIGLALRPTPGSFIRSYNNGTVQVEEHQFIMNKRECIKEINRAVRYAILLRVLLTIPELDPTTVHVVRISDAFFAKNTDLSL